MKRIGALIALALAAGALTASGAAAKSKTAPAAGRKTVCVISDVAHEFYLKKIGITVFGNDASTVPVPEPSGGVAAAPGPTPRKKAADNEVDGSPIALAVVWRGPAQRVQASQSQIVTP